MSLNYNYEKTVKYIHDLEKEINQIRAFCKKLAKNYESFEEDITKMMEERN